MSANNHDPQDPTFIKYKRHEAKSQLSSDEEQIGFYIKIYGSAKNMSLYDFINWCKTNNYHFEKLK